MSRSLLLSGFAVLVAATGGWAQEADSIAPIELDSLMVTVLRTAVPAHAAPYAVSTHAGATVHEARPGLGLDEALRGIPGVQVDNRYNYALGDRISIRGFGARAQFGVRGVKVLVDGVPATFADGQTSLSHVDPGLLRRVEVIRGPAAALYGNTAGGVIQLETLGAPAAPIAQEFGVTAGEDGLLRVRSTTGGQAGGASWVVGLSRFTYDGHRDFNRAEDVRLNGSVRYRRGADDVRLVVSGVDYRADNPGSLSDSLLMLDRTQAYRFNRVQETGEDGQHGQVGLTWRRAVALGEWEAGAYVIGRTVENPIPPAVIDLTRRAGGVRLLLRGAPPATRGGLRWTVGVDGDLQRDDRRNHKNEQGARGALTLDQHERVANAGLFAQIGAEPLPRVTLLGGLRYDWFRFEVEDRLVTAESPDDSGRRILDALSPSLGVSVRVLDGLALYGNIATAFETPTTTELANRPDGAGGFNPALQPQRAVSYEVGGKARLGDRASLDVALYRIELEHTLVPFEVPGAPGRQFFRNAGSAAHQGAEAALAIDVTPTLNLQGAYAWTDARFGRYRPEGEVRDGHSVPGIAPHRLELGAHYRTRTGWFASIEARYVSELPVDDANAFHSPAYVVADVRGGLERLRLRGVDVRPFFGVTNAFDADYNSSVVVNAFGRRYFEPGPARALYAGATVRMPAER